MVLCGKGYNLCGEHTAQSMRRSDDSPQKQMNVENYILVLP